MSPSSDADYADKIWRGEFTPNNDRISVGSGSLTINEMKDAVVRLFEEANKQNFGVFDEMFAPDFVSYGGAGFQDLNGPEAFKQLYNQFVEGLPDLSFRVDQVVAERDLCGVRGTLSGTHSGNFMGFAPPTGKRVTWTGTAILRFNQKGLIDARWQEWDGLSVMQQMGVFPADVVSNVDLPIPDPPYVPDAGYTSPSENKRAIRRLLDEFWNQGIMETADEFFHPQATYPSSPEYPSGPEGVKEVARMLHKAMPDYHAGTVEILADGDLVLMWNSHSGTQTGEFMGISPTGKNITWGEIGILRFAGGQIVESWYNVDILGLFEQLGVGASISAGA